MTDHHARQVREGYIDNRLFFVMCFLYSLLPIFSTNDFFFWDTVQLASKHADFYFKNELVPSFLPNNLDSGHIPAFGYFIACIWAVFGKSLVVSHLVMLPFIWMQVYFLKKILNGLQLKYAGLIFVLCLLHPTLIAQNTLVSPDVVLMSGFLMSLYAILNKKQALLIIGAIGLVLISNRGVMVLAGLGLFDLWVRSSVTGKLFSVTNFRHLSGYLPAAAVFLAFSILHYNAVGWIGFHDNSPWNESFRTSGANMYLRNIMTLVWRFNDFGLFFPVIAGIICTVINRKILFKDKNFLRIFQLFLCISFFLILPALLFFSLSGHRYIMPSTMLILLLSGIAMSSVRYGKILIFISMVSLLTGHLYIYPEKLSQGWDSSLAYKPCISLRNKMVDYMDREGISFDETATFFPNKNTDDHLLLNGSDRTMIAFEEGKNKYVFYSNVYNVADEIQDYLYSNYDIEQQYVKNGVKVILFKSK